MFCGAAPCTGPAAPHAGRSAQGAWTMHPSPGCLRVLGRQGWQAPHFLGRTTGVGQEPAAPRGVWHGIAHLHKGYEAWRSLYNPYSEPHKVPPQTKPVQLSPISFSHQLPSLVGMWDGVHSCQQMGLLACGLQTFFWAKWKEQLTLLWSKIAGKNRSHHPKWRQGGPTHGKGCSEAELRGLRSSRLQ